MAHCNQTPIPHNYWNPFVSPEVYALPPRPTDPAQAFTLDPQESGVEHMYWVYLDETNPFQTEIKVHSTPAINLKEHINTSKPLPKLNEFAITHPTEVFTTLEEAHSPLRSSIRNSWGKRGMIGSVDSNDPLSQAFVCASIDGKHTEEAQYSTAPSITFSVPSFGSTSSSTASQYRDDGNNNIFGEFDLKVWGYHDALIKMQKDTRNSKRGVAKKAWRAVKRAFF